MSPAFTVGVPTALPPGKSLTTFSSLFEMLCLQLQQILGPQDDVFKDENLNH